MSIAIEVRFYEVDAGSYKFQPIPSFAAWWIIPRVGDHILDKNEFAYEVIRIVWYDPAFVQITIRRTKSV